MSQNTLASVSSVPCQCTIQDKNIAITIIVPVYNHENYIEQALYSILMQQVNFEYEVLIGEDCSTDNSREVLKKLQKTFPENFHFYFRDKNMGAAANMANLREKMHGKYICTLEGDDFWTYDGKLQEEYDILENHPEYLAVAHNTKVVDENNNELEWKYPECKNEVYTTVDYERGRLTGQTATILMRNYYSYPILDYHIDPCKLPGDRIRNFLLFCNGNVYCIQKQWSCYRSVISHGSSYSANPPYITVEDEFIIQKSLYNYSKNHDIPKDRHAIIENQFFWFLFKRIIARKIKVSVFFKYYKESKRKLSIILYIIKTVLQYPIFKTIAEIDRMKYYRRRIVHRNVENV